MSDDDVPDLVADELDDEGITIIHVDLPWGNFLAMETFETERAYLRLLRHGVRLEHESGVRSRDLQEWMERFQTPLPWGPMTARRGDSSWMECWIDRQVERSSRQLNVPAVDAAWRQMEGLGRQEDMPVDVLWITAFLDSLHERFVQEAEREFPDRTTWRRT
jgi:hypothetical protein